jgi:hypothetical protein
MHIAVVVVLIAWFAIGVVVVALLNLAKFVVRSSARQVPSSMSSQSTVLSAVDCPLRRRPVGRASPPRHPGATALPPPLATRRSA